MTNIYFHNSWAYRVPDTAHYICEDCIDKKEAKLRPKASFLKSMCDVCEKSKSKVYSIHDVDWMEYTNDNIGYKRWNRSKDESKS